MRQLRLSGISSRQVRDECLDILGDHEADARKIVIVTKGPVKDVERKIGRIAINDAGLSYGYAPFFRYCGADEGDTLRAEFELASAKVHLSLNEDLEEHAE